MIASAGCGSGFFQCNRLRRCTQANQAFLYYFSAFFRQCNVLLGIAGFIVKT